MIKKYHKQTAALLFCFLTVISALPARASDRLSVLEKRIHYLEARLSAFESRSKVPQPARRKQSAYARNSTVTVARPREAVSVDDGAHPTDVPAVADRPTPAIPEPSPGVGQESDAPQETFVFRDNAVTLKPRGVEVSTELDYFRGTKALQSDRALLSATSIRYGAFDWLELGLTVPYYGSRRDTRVLGGVISRPVQGIGDVTGQASIRLFDQTPTLPGAVLTLGAIFPTGASPYNLTPLRLRLSPTPLDVFRSYYSSGGWGVRSNLQVYKTVDPLILFAGVGIEYIFPLSIDGYRIEPAQRLLYNAGVSFAVSEKSTLGFQVDGSYQEKLRVSGKPVPDSGGEPIALRLTLVQRVWQNAFLEPSIAFGLTAEAPNAQLSLALRYRF